MIFLRRLFTLYLLLAVLCGILYPAALTGAAQALFPAQAEGSLIRQDGVVLASELIGQDFKDPRYFWGRPSETSSFPTNAEASGASNLAQSDPKLSQNIKDRLQCIANQDPDNQATIPEDLVLSSASGLDPHISPEAARFQITRIALARGLSEDHIKELIEHYTEPRQFGFLGEPRVNVLLLNLALDGKP
jgi:K+-transporting ATPase ATPase C chain